MENIWTLLLLQAVLIGLNAIFACAEIAVLSFNETKLERMAEGGDKRARRLFALTREPARFLATIQVAITLSGFLGSAFAADNFSEPLVDWVVSLGVTVPRATLDTVAVVLITLVLSYFTLVFGELVPKRLAMKKAEQLSFTISGLVSLIAKIFKPLVWILTASTNTILRLLGIDPAEMDESVSEEEIRMMVDAGSEKGAIDRQEKEYIENVFAFDDLTAEDMATHRTAMDVLWMEDGMDVWDETIHATRHTLYPICGEDGDDIVGVLNAKDYFRLGDKSRENILRQAVRPAYFVPATIKGDVLLRNMRQHRTALSVVLDEYGGVVGIVTFSDLIDQLVGDLEEDGQELNTEPHIEHKGADTWCIIGNVELADIEETLEVELGCEDVDTFSGLVFDALGMIPEEGQQDIRLNFKQLEIHILRVEEHQIVLAEVRVLPPAEEE